VIAQVCVPVHGDDDADSLAARVLAGEHRLYPLVIRWFAEGRVGMQDDRLLLDGKPLESPLRFTPEDLPAA
jgi:phosphoribosylglycinamide formyltransferase-1